jgi:YHS domain-containing protein
MKITLLSLILAGLALPALADHKLLLNLNSSGVAIQGYDPVAFFTDGKPVPGNPKFVTKRDGAIYFFASKEHLETFNTNPPKYEPQFGGYCAYGVSRNKLVEIDVNAFQIVAGRLLLQYSRGVRDSFNQDAQGNLARANANWPGLIEKNGK